MKRGGAVVLGAVVGALLGGVVTALAVLVYFMFDGSTGPEGLGIAVMLAAFAGVVGLVLGALAGGFVGSLIPARQ